MRLWLRYTSTGVFGTAWSTETSAVLPGKRWVDACAGPAIPTVSSAATATPANSALRTFHSFGSCGHWACSLIPTTGGTGPADAREPGKGLGAAGGGGPRRPRSSRSSAASSGAEARVVRVALRAGRVEQLGPRRVLRGLAAPALDEVGVRDHRAADRHGVGVGALDQRDRL